MITIRLRPLSVALVASLALLSQGLMAADLAQWSGGDGDIAKVPAQPGAAIAADVAVDSGQALPARLALSAGARGIVTLAPGSEVVLHERGTAADLELVMDLNQGAVQIDIQDKGRYKDISVVSGGMEVRVTGTLFVVERLAHDKAYVALVRGQIMVRVAAIGKEVAQWLRVQSHQGVGIDGGTLQPVEPLFFRPQIAVASHPGIRQQATASATASHTRGSAWRRDNATALLIQHDLAGNTKGDQDHLLALIRQDPEGAADALASLATSNPTQADRVVMLVATAAPDMLVSFIHEVSAADPGQAEQRLMVAATACPSLSPELAAAAISADPDHAVDLAIAAMVAAPDQSQAILAAACTADPAQAAAITSTATMLYPNLVASTSTPTVKQSPKKIGKPTEFVLPTEPTATATATTSNTPDAGPDSLILDNLGPTTGSLTPPAGTAPGTLPISPER